MKRHLLCVGLVLGAVCRCLAADPYVGYVYPAGLQAGTTNRLVVGGQGFWGIMEAGVSGEGVTVLHVERMALSAPPAGSQRAWLTKWLDKIILKGDRTRPPLPTKPDARVGEWTVNAWWQTLDQLDRRELEAVERDIYIRKNQLQMTPSLRQILFVDVAVAPDAKPGRRDFCVWTPNGISPPRPFYVTAAPHAEEPFYAPPHRAQPAPTVVSAFPAVLDGRIMPGETDAFKLVLKKGQRLSCDVTARELQPYVGDAVPGFFNAVVRLLDPAGREIAFADDRDRFKPDPLLMADIPADGVYTFEIHDNLFRGREDFVYSIAVSTDASAPAAASAPAEDAAAFSLFSPSTWWGLPRLAVGGEVKGVLAAPGEVDRYQVSLEGPGAYVFDLRARRDGSSLDGVLTLVDADGRQVWRQDDVTNLLFVGAVPQAECDAAGRVELAAGERRDYMIAVEDLTRHGGANYGYALSLRREKPGFAVYASRSAFVSRLYTRVPVTFRVVRTGGFTGPVTILETPDYRFEGGVIPAHTNEVKAFFVGKRRDGGPFRDFRMRAFGEPGGVATAVDVVPTDECIQAFAWRHLLTARAFLLKDQPLPVPRFNNLKPREQLLLIGSAATPEIVRDLRLFHDLRFPNRLVEMTATNVVPNQPLKKSIRPLLVTPFPYDQYFARRAPNRNLNDVRAEEAARIRKLASERQLPMAELHDTLTSVLRERPALCLMGEDRETPAEEMRLLALARLVETMGLPGEVASVRINVGRRRDDSTNARVRNLTASPTGVSFTYVAHALPFPVTPAYRRVDKFYPLSQRINREYLHVQGLKTGRYLLRMDGRDVGTFTASEFAKGVNLALQDTPGQRLAQAAHVASASADFVPPRPKPVQLEIVPKK